MGVIDTYCEMDIKILAQTLLFFKHREALKYYKTMINFYFKTERELYTIEKNL